MINQMFIYPIFPLLPLGNVSGIAYSDKETFLNFCASVIYLFAIHLLMRIAIKRTPAYEKNDKEMIVCHVLTFIASLAMVLMFGISDTLIKGTAFYLILLWASVSDVHTRHLCDAASVMVVLVSFVGAEPKDLPSMILSAFFVGGMMFVCAMVSNNRLGGADVKITAASAMVLGVWNTTAGLVVGLFIAVIHNLIKAKGKEKKTISFPLVPYLAIGFMVAFIFKGGI